MDRNLKWFVFLLLCRGSDLAANISLFSTTGDVKTGSTTIFHFPTNTTLSTKWTSPNITTRAPNPSTTANITVDLRDSCEEMDTASNPLDGVLYFFLGVVTGSIVIAIVCHVYSKRTKKNIENEPLYVNTCSCREGLVGFSSPLSQTTENLNSPNTDDRGYEIPIKKSYNDVTKVEVHHQGNETDNNRSKLPRKREKLYDDVTAVVAHRQQNTSQLNEGHSGCRTRETVT